MGQADPRGESRAAEVIGAPIVGITPSAMNIGIIGAGFIGRALASRARASGRDVMLSNSRGPHTLSSTAAALGCEAGTAEEAARFGDVVFLAIPFRNYRAIPVEPLAGKIVVDANNYYPQRDGRIEELEAHAVTTSELIAHHLRGARLVKAFNAIMQADIEKDARPAGSPERRALPIAGDDPEAKRVVASLVDQFGFDPVDAGSLAESWRFERARPAYCIPLDVPGMKAALASAQKHVELPHGSWRRRTT